MNKTNILDLFKKWNFDYTKHEKRFKEIGDVTAIRYKGKVPFRRNYERALLVYAVAEHFQCKNFVEFGTGRGFVTACVSLCESIQDIYTIDCLDSGIKHIKSLSLDTFDKIHFIVKKSQDLKYDEIPESIDLVFIDGEHSYKAAQNDFSFVKDRARIVVFDDYRNKHKGVKKFIKSIDYNKLLVSTDGWIYKNKMIKKHKDADKVVDGKEYDSGQVIVQISNNNIL